MLKWLSGEEGAPGSGAPGSPQGAVAAGGGGGVGGEAALAEMAERLAQTERLVAQLKEMIREKDSALRTKDEQLKADKEACESKLSKLRLQNKAKVTSLTSQLEELKKQHGGQTSPTHSKKGAAESSEQASRGKIVLLKKKVEDLEQQLAQRGEELVDQRSVMEAQRQRGEEMDTMLTERDRKLAEKEAYIVHLQTALAGDQPISPYSKATEDSESLQELQLLVQSLTKKIGEAEERYSLLQEQSDSLKELLATEQGQYSQKETMYKQNIQTFKDIILQKDNQLMEVSQMHEQELFKLAAKSDASADLDQLLKALKQKLHEKEEVLLGKTQVIDVLQGEVDSRDQHIKGLQERLQRMQVERESLEARLEAEKHVMRAQLRDLMEKQQAEARRVSEQHQAQMARAQHDLLQQIDELRRAPGGEDRPVDSATMQQRLAQLEAQAKQKTEEAGKSEAKFMKVKAWSKSRIKQLEDELKKSQAGAALPDLTALRNHITELEEERQESLWKLDQYEELKDKNDVLEAKLVVYEEQQRSLLADLEQVTKRAASQASESGSTDDTSQLLEWQEMVSEAVSARDRAKEEKASMALRMSHMEEEREALASRQQELEEELAQARRHVPHRAQKLAAPAQHSLQEDFEFDGQRPFQEPGSAPDSTAPMEGENMGGWWPEYSTPDTGGLRSVVEELELERNQLQEQILGLEEHCQDLEDRLQLQSRIETLQNESEKLQGQLATLRSQQSRDAEKHQILVTSLNEQLKGLSDTQECLESSLIEKENTLARTTEKLELITSLQESLSEKEMQYKDVSDKLLQTEHNLTEISKKCSGFEKQCLELKKEVAELTQKCGVLKEKTQKQDVTIETLQTDLDQTNDELDKLNNTHLGERAQLIHDLQSCEREIDSLKDILLDKEKEMVTLSSNMLEYSEQITTLKQELKLKEDDLVRVECELSKAQREVKVFQDTQDSDHQGLNNKITELVEKLKDTETELTKAKAKSESKVVEVEDLIKQTETDKKLIQDLRGEIQKHIVSHHNHLTECETHISSLKEQMTLSTHKLEQEVEDLILQLKDKNTCIEKLQKQFNDNEHIHEKELKAIKEGRNKLLAEVEKLNSDLQILSKQIDENRVENQGHLETIVSLEDQLKVMERENDSERHTLVTNLRTRDSELNSKSDDNTKLKNLLKNLNVEKQELQERLNGLAEELESQKTYGQQMNEKLKAALDLTHNLKTQESCLMKENEKLQLEVTENKKLVLEYKMERESLQNKMSALDNQHLEKIKVIQGLQKDKEELSINNNELNRILQQSTQSTSESLLEKNNECSHLIHLLREREEKLEELKEQLQKNISQVEELQLTVEGRDQLVTDLKMELESQQSQKVQLQDTLSLLQEQGTSLKSGLMERDVMLKQKQDECNIIMNEMAEMKSNISRLQADTVALLAECTHLHQQIEMKDENVKSLTTEGQKYKDELNNSNEIVKSVTSKLSAMEEHVTKLDAEKTQVKKALDNYDTEYLKLKTQLEQRLAETVTFQGHIQTLTEQNIQLRTGYEIRERELAQQIQISSDLDKNIKVSLAENSNLIKKIDSLTKDNHKLQKDLELKSKYISELDTEKSSLQEKISGLEMQHSENRKIIEGLLKHKEDLTLAVHELNNVIEQSKQSNTESLMVKTTECNGLLKSLREKDEHTALLQEQVDTLKRQAIELHLLMSEKEKTVSDQHAMMKFQQAQITQLQETSSLLQEQASVLKSGLMEKDTMFQHKAEECSSYQNEVILQKDLISKMQSEAGSIREECLKLKQQFEEKEQSLEDLTQDFQKCKDELNKRNESLNALGIQISLMNESSSMADAEMSNINTRVEKLTGENDLLKREVDKKRVEVVDLEGSIQVLSEQNAMLKTELQMSCTEQSELLVVITNLRALVCDKENQVSNLTAVLESVSLAKESLSLTLQEKEETLKQKETFALQLFAKSVEVKGQTSQQSDMITHLHSEVLTLQETIAGIKSELGDSNAKNKELRNRLTEQDIQLQQKVEENVHLYTQLSEFKETISNLICQVDTLTSESNVLKEAVKVKYPFILNTQSSSSAVSEHLSSKLVDKNTECESIKEQVSHLQESVTKLNNTLQAKLSEIESLKETLEEKDMVLLDQSRSIQEMLRKTDEAELFKTQLLESTELVSKLQSQMQLFTSESVNLNQSVEETQSAFNNLQEKYADHLEELQAVRMQLAQKTEDVLSLSKKLNESTFISNSTLDSVRGELSVIQEEFRKAQDMISCLLKEKEDAFTAHQESMSSLTVEIEKLKSQHLQVVAQMNGLTENLEQREMALHAINSQYAAQAKHTANVVSEIQKLEEQNKILNEELRLSKEEHQKHLNTVINENAHLQQEFNRLVAEKDELERRQGHQLRAAQGVVELQIQQQSSSMNELKEKMLSEKLNLQAEVSEKMEEITGLKVNIKKIEQVLQDSEKEWLFVLDRETKDKNILVEQLKCIENEMNSKDSKVNSLKQEFENLQKKLAEAASAIRLGSDQLKAKEMEASASRVQLEKIWSSVQEKDKESNVLQQSLQAMERELQKLEANKMGTDKDMSVLSQTMTEKLAAFEKENVSLKVMMKQMQDNHQLEFDYLRHELDSVSIQLQDKEYTCREGETSLQEKCQQITHLQENVEQLHGELNTESVKLKDMGVIQSLLHNQLQGKDEQISSMTIQISQQKELVAGLSQQLKDKDIAIAHVMESASNERMKLSEEKSGLIAKLENIEHAHSISVKTLEDLSKQLEERIEQYQVEIETSNSKNDHLMKDNNHLKDELRKLSKEKEQLKKKLQAALLVRKDLLKRSEQYESQKEQMANDGAEMSLLQAKLNQIASQTQATTKDYEENILILENRILEKDGKISSLEKARENLHTDINILEVTLNEKELYLSETLNALSEKSSLIEQLHSSISEKEASFKCDTHDMIKKLEELQNDLKRSEALLKDKCVSTTADLENELTQLKQEKTILQKKTQAALLARKETMKKSQENEKRLLQELSELKDYHKSILEQHCQQTNELNAVQLEFDHQAKQLEDVSKASLMNINELETLRHLVVERDKSLQDLKSMLAEKETEEHVISTLQSDLKTVTSKLENITFEMTKKCDDFVTLENKSQTLKTELEKAHAKIKEQTEELEKCHSTIQIEKQSLIDYNVVLQNKLSHSQAILDELKPDLDAHIHEKEQKYQIWREEKSSLLEKMALMKLELETALHSVSQKASEIQHIQNALTETQHELNEVKYVLAKELDKAQLHCAEKESNKMHMELLQQEKDNAFQIVDQLREEVTILNMQIRQAENHHEQLHQTTPGLHKDILMKEYVDKLEVKSLHQCSEIPKERDDAFLISQALVVEKEELIASLEQQLQRQIHLHESAMDKMRTEINELQQRSREDWTKTTDDSQSKTALLTRKLQAALISRKELLKENTSVREQLQTLSVKHEQKEAEFNALELSVSHLKHQNLDLESFISLQSKEKDRLLAEVERISNDNQNLSAACESLKQTIENITQQKQAFSCQLESLKDSQTEELSVWKSKHSELKQEYESLLQAYENVSNEMDKMRQLVEVAKKERQEALCKVHQYEAQRESLEKTANDIEEENVRIKDKMRKFAKTKQQKIEELEEEIKKYRKELMIFNGNKLSTDELTLKNKQLEVAITSLEESLAEVRENLTKVESENAKLSENLQEASSSLERWTFESKLHENNMQIKLNEALDLNNSLTVQIESQNANLRAQQKIIELLQKEKHNLSARNEQLLNDQDLHLGEKDTAIKELQGIINKHSQETVSLNEKVRILEDDKSLLQEELENTQEISDKVKNENEYLETVILQNSEKIDELTESIRVWQTQNAELSSQLTVHKEKMTQVFQEKEHQQMRLLMEYEKKLKTVQMGNEGPKNMMKELQALVKEKHHEITSLQQDYIKYQEVILDLERSCKTSQSAYEHLEKEHNKGLEQRSILEERIEELEVELTKHKYLLKEVTERYVNIQSEKDKLALEISEKIYISEHGVIDRTIALENVEEQKTIHMEKHTILQQQIDELQHVMEQKTQVVAELRQQIDSKDLQIISLKRETETTAAKLSAMSSTFQGADSIKQWNDIFQKTLHDKDSQLLEQGFVIKRFLEDMRVKEIEISDLRVTKSRLERTMNEYSIAAAAQQRQLFVLGANNTELTETVETITIQLKELKAQSQQLEQDKILLVRQLADKEDISSQMQLDLQQLKKINSDTDTQLLLLQSESDKLQADFEKQEAFSVQLKMLIDNKNAEIYSLLSSQDGQMSGYLQQLHANHHAEVASYEDKLVSSDYNRGKADKELRRLESKVRYLEIKVNKSNQEREHMQSKMESFRNSLISLQTEREKLMSEYRILDAKNQFASREREGTTDTTSLKYEIRKLLHQMDDLNSENAMLRAQLVRYREDLNQVLSLKDNQLKVMLKKQQDMIKNLENQKASAEKQHRESLLKFQNEEEASNALKIEISKLKSQVTKLEVDILALMKEKAGTNEGKVIADLQQTVATKAAECNDFQQKLIAQKMLTDTLKDKLRQLERETDNKLANAEDKYNSELDTLEREVQLMRNEREIADRRVAELAGDLLQTEKLLCEAQAQGKNIKAQNESLGRAMAALQNDRDQLIEDFKVLQSRYDEELRETQAAMTKVEHRLQQSISELVVLDKERHILAHKTKALESKHTHSELSTLVEELSKELSQKERELKQVTLDNDTYRKQVSAFSRSMASLQNDRDRLMDELVGTKKVVESRQGSDTGTIVSLSVDESNENRDDVFHNRDGLKMRLKVAELQKALKEVQVDRLQIEKDVSSYQSELHQLQSERNMLLSECQALKENQQAADRTDGQSVKEADASVGQSVWEETIHHLQIERVQLHRDLQRCVHEIQQRDQQYQQLNNKMQQALEERGAVASQLRAVSQTLRDTQNRCHWLESQVPGQTMQGSVYAEVAPGAPQEISSHSISIETNEASQLRDRLSEVEQSLAEETARRQAAEEALGLAENRAQSVSSSPSRASQRDFSIQLETEEEWEALILNPNQPLLTRKVKGGVLACRRWLRGRSLYCSKLLTSRARSRYVFLAYLFTLHVVVFMCLTGAL